jgi:hypothetical protein
VDRVAAFRCRSAHHVVLDADVGEGAAHHHFVVAAARAVLVEVGHGDAVLGQVFAGGRGGLDRAGRRDVVGGDLVAEEAEDAGALDVGEARRGLAHADEVGRVLHVGRACRPRRRSGPAGTCTGLPVLVALEDVGVRSFEDSRVTFSAMNSWISVRVGQMSLRKTGLAVLSDAERLGGQVLLVTVPASA